ncbi:MAG: thiolase family protein [Desulfatitalea sp.]|nr:thiolase family protein [Desulfatitalea sp.]NNK01128.1 thiolase family protein [Desulfatitalea sp.]
MKDAYIVSSVRTPGCKRAKGAFKDTLPLDLIAFIMKSSVEKISQLDPHDIDDVLVGCAFPEAEQGLNIGRNAAKIAGFPDHVPGVTVNRFCASGLEAIADAALRIMTGWADVTIGAGVESMSYVPMGGTLPRPYPDPEKKQIAQFISMGATAENVANRYKVSREQQDEFAYNSHMKAASAQKEGRFTEIVPTPAAKFVLQPDGTPKRDTFIQKVDDGVRADTTIEGLSKLRPVFALNGSVTAGNASQTTDGAAATVLMSEEKVKALGIKPIAKLKLYATIGCRSDEMGVGPRYAIPKLLDKAGLTIDDIGAWEINEAFASQALYCIRELGMEKYMDRINMNGGAIALGHPLGCTGAKLCATLLANMQRTGAKYGVESMCIAGGMGAAALFELCD